MNFIINSNSTALFIYGKTLRSHSRWLTVSLNWVKQKDLLKRFLLNSVIDGYRNPPTPRYIKGTLYSFYTWGPVHSSWGILLSLWKLLYYNFGRSVESEVWEDNNDGVKGYLRLGLRKETGFYLNCRCGVWKMFKTHLMKTITK